jgi:hypothetical protein
MGGTGHSRTDPHRRAPEDILPHAVSLDVRGDVGADGAVAVVEAAAVAVVQRVRQVLPVRLNQPRVRRAYSLSKLEPLFIRFKGGAMDGTRLRNQEGRLEPPSIRLEDGAMEGLAGSNLGRQAGAFIRSARG